MVENRLGPWFGPVEVYPSRWPDLKNKLVGSDGLWIEARRFRPVEVIDGGRTGKAVEE